MPYISPFAQTVNYPSGSQPWSNTPTKVNPNYTYFTPGQAPSAQELNYLFNSYSAGLMTAQNIAAQNFTMPITASSLPNAPQNVTAIGWCPLSGVWLLGGINSAGTQGTLCTTYGTGDTPMNLSLLGTKAVYAAMENPSNGLLYAIVGNGLFVAPSLTVGAAISTATWTLREGIIGGGVDGEIWMAYATAAQLMLFNQGVLWWATGPTLGGGVLVMGGFYDVSGNYHPKYNIPATCMAASPTLALMMTTDNTYYTTPDGVAWTTCTGPWGSTYAVVSIAYGSDVIGPCWLAVTYDGAHQQIWRTSDGISWVSVNSSAVNNLRPLRIVCVQGTWYGVPTQSSPGNPLCISLDGITWQISGTELAGTPSPTLVANTQGLAYGSNSAVRFSQLLGLGAVIS